VPVELHTIKTRLHKPADKVYGCEGFQRSIAGFIALENLNTPSPKPPATTNYFLVIEATALP